MISFETEVLSVLGDSVISADGSTVVCGGLLASPFKGKIDELRISMGIVRNSADFAPPGEAYDGYGLPTSIVSSLGHLEGKEVTIVSDGNILDSQTVSNATITLTDSASLIHIGLPYKSDMETLNIEIPLSDGTMQGKRVMISRVMMRMANSRGGYIGPTFTNLKEILGDYRTSTDASLYTGDIKVNLGQGYKDGGNYCFRQTDPMPVTILGLLPIVTAGGSSGI